MRKKKRSLRNENLTVNRVPETEQRKERLKIEKHEKQHLSTLKGLKRGEVEEKPKTGEGGR